MHVLAHTQLQYTHLYRNLYIFSLSEITDVATTSNHYHVSYHCYATNYRFTRLKSIALFHAACPSRDQDQHVPDTYSLT